MTEEDLKSRVNDLRANYFSAEEEYDRLYELLVYITHYRPTQTLELQQYIRHMLIHTGKAYTAEEIALVVDYPADVQSHLDVMEQLGTLRRTGDKFELVVKPTPDVFV